MARIISQDFKVIKFIARYAGVRAHVTCHAAYCQKYYMDKMLFLLLDISTKENSNILYSLHFETWISIFAEGVIKYIQHCR